MDGFTPDQLERLFPGVIEAIRRLNARTGASQPEELFAAWVVERYGDSLCVAAVQPHYVKGAQKSFWWDGEDFV